MLEAWAQLPIRRSAFMRLMLGAWAQLSIRSSAWPTDIAWLLLDGVVVTVYWNGNEFGSAVQHFYATNPQLCGEFQGQHIDIVNCTLETPR